MKWGSREQPVYLRGTVPGDTVPVFSHWPTCATVEQKGIRKRCCLNNQFGLVSSVRFSAGNIDAFLKIFSRHLRLLRPFSLRRIGHIVENEYHCLPLSCRLEIFFCNSKESEEHITEVHPVHTRDKNDKRPATASPSVYLGTDLGGHVFLRLSLYYRSLNSNKQITLYRLPKRNYDSPLEYIY